jgi:tetratricopeptide (TPR) repeat protein
MGVKRTVGLLAILGTAIVWAALSYQGAMARERGYRALLRKGDAALQQGETFEAVEAYSNAIYLRPDSMLARLRRGETYHRRGDLEAAARDFRNAAEIDPSATRPLEALGDVRYKQERFRQAAETYESRLRVDDRSAIVTRKLALARYRGGNLDAAVAALEQLAKLGDRVADDFYLLGLCLRDKQLLRDAVVAFQKAIQLSPNLIPPREELADLFEALDRPSDQLHELQVLVGLDPHKPERQISLGLAFARAGRIELAVHTLVSALERAPDQTLIYGAIGRVWLDSWQARNDPAALRKAIEALERAATTPGAGSEIMVLYGRALLADGQIEAAERVYQQATERFPIEPAAFLAYADVAERRGHLELARRALVEYGALVTDEQALSARARRIGGLSLRLNEPQRALPWLERASGTFSDHAFLALLADAQFRTGDHASARATALQGLEKEPTSATLRSVELRTRDIQISR